VWDLGKLNEATRNCVYGYNREVITWNFYREYRQCCICE